ncbi:MAG: formate dehydrogenase accessory sulfurtransferase FdhD [bacterium]
MSGPPSPLPPDGMRETDLVQYDRDHPGGYPRQSAVILERPLSVEVDGTTYTFLRTPGADRELVVGFLFTEGLIAKPDDILLLRECLESPDVITVKTSDVKDKPRRTLLITSSCGLCGLVDIRAMVEALGRVESPFRVPVAAVYRVPATVRAMQPLFDLTGAAHASALFDAVGRVACVKEDVGRHNALDKLIGHALLRGIPLSGRGVFLSGRTSLELIAKAARARMPVVAAVGAPTAAAVEAADRLGITLCGFLRDERISVYTHGWRVMGSQDGREQDTLFTRQDPIGTEGLHVSNAHHPERGRK